MGKQISISDNSQNNCVACTDISMHNTSWAALGSGQMGIPLQWHAHNTWNETGKTDLEDFYSNLDGLASFVNGLDFETHKYRPSVKNEDHLFHEGGVLGDENPNQNDALPFEVFSMQNNYTEISESDRAFGWINHRHSRWDWYTSGTITNLDPVTNKPIVTCNFNNLYSIWNNIQKSNPNEYWLNHFKTGNYFLNIYDTRTGLLINSYLPGDPESPYVDPVTHTLLLKLPFESLTFSRPDIAFKLWHVSVDGNNFRTSHIQSNTQNDLLTNDSELSIVTTKMFYEENFSCKLSPNPSRNFITIESFNQNIYSITIKDPSGKIVEEISDLNTNLINIENHFLSSGLYFIKVVSSNGSYYNLKCIKL